MQESVHARAVGQYPISIATSLAVESSLGIHSDRPQETRPVMDYDEIRFNIRTLYRNFMGSLNKETYNGIDAGTIIDALQEEMEMIKSIYKEYKPKLLVTYYISEYKGLKAVAPYGAIKEETTEKQRYFKALFDASMLELFSRLKHEVYRYDLFMESLSSSTRSMVNTHIPFDLLSSKSFKELVLLESHTGAIKDSSQWYTKYTGGRELYMLPFNLPLLQIFGDSEMFKQQPSYIRRPVKDIAVEYNWSNVTTLERQKLTLGFIKDPSVKSSVLKFY